MGSIGNEFFLFLCFILDVLVQFFDMIGIELIRIEETVGEISDKRMALFCRNVEIMRACILASTVSSSLTVRSSWS